MIFDSYLLLEKLQQTQPQQVKYDEPSTQHISYEARSAQMNMQQSNVGGTAMVLGLILMVVISIFLAYIFYNCIKTNCMSFIVFLLFIIALNIPVLNIFAFVFLIIYWLVYCRKGCRPTR